MFDTIYQKPLWWDFYENLVWTKTTKIKFCPSIIWLIFKHDHVDCRSAPVTRIDGAGQCRVLITKTIWIQTNKYNTSQQIVNNFVWTRFAYEYLSASMLPQFLPCCHEYLVVLFQHIPTEALQCPLTTYRKEGWAGQGSSHSWPAGGFARSWLGLPGFKLTY